MLRPKGECTCRKCNAMNAAIITCMCKPRCNLFDSVLCIQSQLYTPVHVEGEYMYTVHYTVPFALTSTFY